MVGVADRTWSRTDVCLGNPADLASIAHDAITVRP
jgi:hypothetical protein